MSGRPQKWNQANIASDVSRRVIEFTDAEQTLYMNAYQTNILLVNELAAGDDENIVLYLPPVMEAEGRTYTFRLDFLGDSGTATCTVTNLDGADHPSYDALAAVHDQLTLRSNGASWQELTDDLVA